MGILSSKSAALNVDRLPFSAKSLDDKSKGMTDIRASKSVEQDGKESGQEKNVNVKFFGLLPFSSYVAGVKRKRTQKMAVWNRLLIKLDKRRVCPCSTIWLCHLVMHSALWLLCV